MKKTGNESIEMDQDEQKPAKKRPKRILNKKVDLTKARKRNISSELQSIYQQLNSMDARSIAETVLTIANEFRGKGLSDSNFKKINDNIQTILRGNNRVAGQTVSVEQALLSYIAYFILNGAGLKIESRLVTQALTEQYARIITKSKPRSFISEIENALRNKDISESTIHKFCQKIANANTMNNAKLLLTKTILRNSGLKITNRISAIASVLSENINHINTFNTKQKILKRLIEKYTKYSIALK